MAQLLVVVHGADLENPFDDAGVCKAGDVVEVVDDAHEWSDLEKTKSEWRILRVSGTMRAAHEALLWSQTHVDVRAGIMSKPGPILSRVSTLNLDTADPALRAYLDDDTRVRPAHDISANWLASAIRMKDRGPRTHPAVLG